MGDEHRREAVLPPQAQQVVVEAVARDLVEGREGLVHEQDARPCHQRTGDRHAHLHAAGELARIGLLEALEADQRQHLGGAGLGLGLAHGFEHQRHHHVGDGGRPRHQRRVLEDEAEIALGTTGGIIGRRRPVDAAGAGCAEPGDHAQQRRLAAARRAQQADELALREVEIDIPDRERAVAELLGDPGDADQRPRHRGAVQD